MNRSPGLLFVVSAPSGAGKTSLCKAITETMENLTHSISYTTRRAREMEIDGRDYYFIAKDRFEEMAAAGDFAEWAQVHENYYGTSRRVLDEMRAGGVDVILDIDTQGAKQIKSRYAGAVFIFILPPSLPILEERLRNRRSDHDEEIRKRMARAREEIGEYRMYDFVIVNRDFDRALADLKAIISSERCRTAFVDPSWIGEMTRKQNSEQ